MNDFSDFELQKKKTNFAGKLRIRTAFRNICSLYATKDLDVSATTWLI